MSDIRELFCEDVADACPNCGGTGFVCENHPDKPWASITDHPNACDCGAGERCPTCYGDGEMVDQTNPGSVRVKEEARERSELRYARQWAVEQVMRAPQWQGYPVRDILRAADDLANFVADGSTEEGSGKPAE